MADNQTRFNQGMDRILGGLPGKAARPDRRIADDLDIAGLPTNIMLHPVDWYDINGNATKKTSLGNFLGWIDQSLGTLMRAINEAKEGIAGVTAAVKLLSEKQGVDPAALEALIDKAVSEAADKHLSDIGTYELRKVEETK